MANPFVVSLYLTSTLYQYVCLRASIDLRCVFPSCSAVANNIIHSPYHLFKTLSFPSGEGVLTPWYRDYPNMPRNWSEAIPEGNGPVPQQEKFESDRPTLADVYRRIEELFNKSDR